MFFKNDEFGQKTINTKISKTIILISTKHSRHGAQLLGQIMCKFREVSVKTQEVTAT